MINTQPKALANLAVRYELQPYLKKRVLHTMVGGPLSGNYGWAIHGAPYAGMAKRRNSFAERAGVFSP